MPTLLEIFKDELKDVPNVLNQPKMETIDNNKFWIRDRIEANNRWVDSEKVIIRRFFDQNRVVLDFIGGGRCATYDYNGKWIIG